MAGERVCLWLEFLSKMAPSGWLKGTVKSVTSGDTLTIMGVARGAAPPEKQITLSSLKAPRLVRTPHERGERTNEHTDRHTAALP